MSTNGNDYRKANMEKARNARKSKTEIRNAYEEQIKRSSVINKDAENYFNRIIEEKERTIELLKEMLFRNNEKPKEPEKDRFTINNAEDYAIAKQMKEYKDDMRRRGLAVIANDTFSGF